MLEIRWKCTHFPLITFLLLIIDNNIESRKNRLQWEESAYLISIKFNENSKSYEGKMCTFSSNFEQNLLFFRSSKVSWTKTLHKKRYLLSAHSSVMINLIISKNKLAFTVTVLQKNVNNLWKCVEIDKNQGK